MEYFGKNLKHFRGKMSQEELGKKFGVGNSQIGHYEAGRSYPTVETGFDIVGYFGFTFEQFFKKDLTHLPTTNGDKRKSKKMAFPTGGDYEEEEPELIETDVGGVSMATESPPLVKEDDTILTKEDAKKLKKLLELIS